MATSSSAYRVNKRRAKEIAAKQADDYQRNLAQKQISSVPERSASTQEALESGYLTQEQRDSAMGAHAETRATNMDRLAQPAAQLSPETVEAQKGITNTILDKSSGRIQDSERQRLRDAGYSDAQIAEREAQLRPAISDTMTNTGLGVQFDSQGRVVQGSGRLPLNSPGARFEEEKRAKREADLAATKGYVKRYDKDGNEFYAEDAGATAQAQEDAKNRYAMEDYAGAVNAKNKQEAEYQNRAVNSLNAFLATLPEDQAAQAQAMLQPLLDAMGQQNELNEQKFQEGMAAIEDGEARTAAYVQKQMADNDMFFRYFAALNERNLDRQLESAESVRQQKERIAEREQARNNQLFNRAIRDQMIKNEEDRKNQLLGLGITGGWRASRQTADVINALNKGERLLSDLYNDQAFYNSQAHDKLLDIEDEYHMNVSSAYEAHDAANANLFGKMMERGATIDKTIYEAENDYADAKAKLIGDFLDSYGKNAVEFAKMVTDQQKYAYDTYLKLRKEDYDRQRDIYGDAMKYVDTYGTQNKQQLSIFEQSLGLLPGSLSNQQTLEEIRLYKTATRGGSKMGVADLASYIDTRMGYLGQIMPEKPLEERAKMILNEVGARYGSGSGGRETVGTAADYLNIHYGQPGSFYESTPITSNIGSGMWFDTTKPPVTTSGFYLVPEKSPIVEVNNFDPNDL